MTSFALAVQRNRRHRKRRKMDIAMLGDFATRRIVLRGLEQARQRKFAEGPYLDADAEFANSIPEDNPDPNENIVRANER